MATTTFIIAGREYNARSAMSATLNVWRRVLLEQGVGMKTVLADVAQIKTISDVTEDPKLQKSFMVYIWVLRLAAGENVTFEEANDVALDDFKVRIEADEEPAEAPKAGTDSAPAERPAEAE